MQQLSRRQVLIGGMLVNGWENERHWPLHALTNRRPRSKTAPGGQAAMLTILKALLKAGAAPDAPWDNGLTMLMWCDDAEYATILIQFGADPNQRDNFGQTALHHVGSSGKVRVLVAHGGDVNIVSAPPPDYRDVFSAATPLQRALQWGRLPGRPGGPRPADLVPALLELGADPKIRDGYGRNTLWYCHTIEDFKHMQSYGLDPFEKDTSGATLLHNAAWETRIAHPQAIEFFKFLLSLGLDVNAQDGSGSTILHFLAVWEGTREQDVRLAIESGADKNIKDVRGRRPYDVALKSNPEVRETLK